MRVHLRRSGGLAGALHECILDTDGMEPADAGALRALVSRCDVEALSSSRSPGARDLFQYDLEIERGGRTVRISFDDLTVPVALGPLLEHLCDHLTPASPEE